MLQNIYSLSKRPYKILSTVVVFLLLIVGLSFAIPSEASSHPTDAAVLHCELNINTSAVDVEFLSASFTTPDDCDTEDDCADCLADLLVMGCHITTTVIGLGDPVYALSCR